MPAKYINLESNNLRQETSATIPKPLSNMELMEKYGITPWLRLVYSIHFGKTLKDVLT